MMALISSNDLDLNSSLCMPSLSLFGSQWQSDEVLNNEITQDEIPQSPASLAIADDLGLSCSASYRSASAFRKVY